MSVQVSVPVLYNGNGQFLDGSLFGVSKEAFVIGPATRDRNPYKASMGTVETLKVKDPTQGVLYLLMTRDEWAVAVNVAKNGTTITALDANISTVNTPDDTLFDEAFSRPLSEIDTDQQVYILNVDYTQNVVDKTITWLNKGSFIDQQVLIAK